MSYGNRSTGFFAGWYAASVERIESPAGYLCFQHGA